MDGATYTYWPTLCRPIGVCSAVHATLTGSNWPLRVLLKWLSISTPLNRITT